MSTLDTCNLPRSEALQSFKATQRQNDRTTERKNGRSDALKLCSSVIPDGPQTAAMGIDDLHELMRSVAQTAQRLAATHVSLQDHVSRLQRELAEANAALRRSQALAALGEMAAGIAHEVRNPLASIQLYVQMLAEDLSDRPDQIEVCSKIRRAIQSLDGIVRDVMAFARDTAIRPQAIAASELVDRAISNCESLLTGNVTLRCDIPVPYRLEVDPGLMTQALTNIIRNAIEAMNEANTPAPGLRLSAMRKRIRCPGAPRRSQWRIILAVQDNGPGVRPEVMDRIFNPFFTTRPAGTGLGLAIVHRIVDAHGGHINIENINPSHGGGARVELCLPSKPPPSEGEKPRIPIHRDADPPHSLGYGRTETDSNPSSSVLGALTRSNTA